MVLDSSAIIAILTNKLEATQFAKIIANNPKCVLSAASFLETAIVIEARYGVSGGLKLDEFIKAASISIEPVTPAQADLARQAFRQYSKGRHPASSNYGDCFSYALAKSCKEPLLYKRDDFAKTDIVSANTLSW